MNWHFTSELYGLVRVLASWVSQSLAFLAMSYFVPGLHVDAWQGAFAAVAIVTLLNAMLWPLLSVYALRLLVFTFGLAALALNGLIVWISTIVVHSVHITIPAILLVPIGLGFIEATSYALPSSDDPEGTRARYHAYFRQVLDRKVEYDARSKSARKTTPGIVFLEIDGLARRVLENAIQQGFMPTVAKWLADGSHKILQWETDCSSQTSAGQAGILLGNNYDVVGFRWFEKERDRIIVSSRLAEAAILEKRLSNGNGLLAINGASRGNLFSGDAGNVLLTISRMPKISRLYTDSWYLFYSNPYSFARTIALFGWDIILETWSRVRQKLRNVQPRLHRSLQYFLVRAVSVVLLREIITYTVIGDIAIGHVDVVYASYSAYDEVAHHNGREDKDAYRVLHQLDKTFARIERARKNARRRYEVVILSDHGQSNGPTFKQVAKMSLGELVTKLLPEDVEAQWDEYDVRLEHLADMNTHPVQLAKDLFRRITKRGPGEVRRPKGAIEELTKSHAIVLASGNLATIYFTRWKERVTLEQVQKEFPKVIPGLLENPYIGFLMMESEEHGPTVIGRSGIYYLAEDRIMGKDPLENFGSNARRQLIRESAFPHAPDILVNSSYDVEKDEVYAFETQIGSHGGLGGDQVKPFLLVPSDWMINEDLLVGAEKLHDALKSQIGQLTREGKSIVPKVRELEQYAT